MPRSLPDCEVQSVVPGPMQVSPAHSRSLPGVGEGGSGFLWRERTELTLQNNGRAVGLLSVLTDLDGKANAAPRTSQT